MLAGYFLGLGPSLLCAGLSVLTAYFFFMPRGSDSLLGLATGDLIALIFFTAILLFDCLLLNWLAEAKTLAAKRTNDLWQLTKNCPDVLTRFDTEFRHAFVSAAIEEWTGRPSIDFIGKTNRELGMPTHLCDQWDAALKSVFTTKRQVSLRFEYDGSILACTLVPEFEDGSNRVKSVLGVTRDVSEIVRHQRALEASDRLKDQMMATVAHELRNPVATIMAGLTVLERQFIDSERATKTLGAMRRQTVQMNHLVRDLLDLGRARAGLIELEKTRFDLRDVLSQSMEACHDLSLRKGVVCTAETPSEPMILEGNFPRLLQVFSNILTNAIKFSKRGDTVVVNVVNNVNSYSVSVIDHGAGMEPDAFDNVFEPFFQTADGKRERSGLGIGLALVKRFVAMHGGNVWATSEGLGKGSTFTVEIPAGIDAGVG